MSTNHLPLMAMGLGVGRVDGAASSLLARKQADIAVPGASTTPPILNLGDDLVMMIVLMAADVFNSIEHANSVIDTRFFGDDGYGAVERLCMSLQTLNNWCQVNSQACNNNEAMLTAAKNSITAKLRQFINRVNSWQIENPDGMTDAQMSKKIAYMCDHLRELYDTWTVSGIVPLLSRQRAFDRPSHT